jgi:hypothetical protein
MSSDSFVMKFQAARSGAKWPTVIASVTFFILSFLYEVFLVDHTPHHYGEEPYEGLCQPTGSLTSFGNEMTRRSVSAVLPLSARLKFAP